MNIDTVLSTDCTPATSYFRVPKMLEFLVKVPGVLRSSECEAIIQIAENAGFSRACLYTDKNGVEHMSTIRKSDRCILDSAPFAAELYRRLSPYIPAEIRGCKVVGINDRLRILKYSPGDEFEMHMDGTFISKVDASHSVLSVLVYLNEGYEGGFTTFIDFDSADVELVPQTGMVVLQKQTLLHWVPPLKKGVKYAIRTEVMYAAPPCKEEDVKVVKV